MIKCIRPKIKAKNVAFQLKKMYPSSGNADVLQGAKGNYFTRFSTHNKLPCLFPPSSHAFSRLIPLLQTFIGAKIDRKGTSYK